MSIRFLVGLAALGALVLPACSKQPESGGAKPPAPPPEQQKAAEPAPAPEIPWEQKTHHQKLEYMGHVVFPKMKAVFQEHDPQGFADFKCQTCHGDDMEAVDFKMPNALFALSTKNTVESATDYDAETTKFMVEKVVPTMAKLLGMQTDQTETHHDFGCFNCHQKE